MGQLHYTLIPWNCPRLGIVCGGLRSTVDCAFVMIRISVIKLTPSNIILDVVCCDPRYAADCDFVMIRISVMKLTPSNIFFLVRILILFLCTITMSTRKTKRKVADMAIEKKTGGRKQSPIRCECLVCCPLDRGFSPITATPA